MPHSFSGRRVGVNVGLIVVLTAIVPPAAAYGLAQWRVTRAEEQSAATAAALGSRKAELLAVADDAAVLAGAGRLPRAAAPAAAWLQNPVSASAGFEAIWPRDPWRQAYLLDLRALRNSGAGLLLSAGPNGAIETPLGASSPWGDDIAARVR